MRHCHHITDPPLTVAHRTLRDEDIDVVATGSPYGRVLFTDWSPTRIHHNVLYNGSIRISRGRDVIIYENMGIGAGKL
jgi:hypothetical protein